MEKLKKSLCSGLEIEQRNKLCSRKNFNLKPKFNNKIKEHMLSQFLHNYS